MSFCIISLRIIYIKKLLYINKDKYSFIMRFIFFFYNIFIKNNFYRIDKIKNN